MPHRRRAHSDLSLIKAAEFAELAHCTPRLARLRLRASLGPGTLLLGAERWPLDEVMALVRRDIAQRRQHGPPADGEWR